MAATTAEGIYYVVTSNNDVIMKFMYLNRRNWVADDMKIFRQLAKKFYDIDDSDGYFLNLGANIGTSGIFFKFNPYIWQKFGCYEKLMALLTALYEGFILVKEVTEKKEINVYPIEELWQFQNIKHTTAELGDIFLIHKL